MDRSQAGYSPWGRKQLDMTEGQTLIFYHLSRVTLYCQAFKQPI